MVTKTEHIKNMVWLKTKLGYEAEDILNMDKEELIAEMILNNEMHNRSSKFGFLIALFYFALGMAIGVAIIL